MGLNGVGSSSILITKLCPWRNIYVMPFGAACCCFDYKWTKTTSEVKKK